MRLAKSELVMSELRIGPSNNVYQGPTEHTHRTQPSTCTSHQDPTEHTHRTQPSTRTSHQDPTEHTHKTQLSTRWADYFWADYF